MINIIVRQCVNWNAKIKDTPFTTRSLQLKTPKVIASADAGVLEVKVYGDEEHSVKTAMVHLYENMYGASSINGHRGVYCLGHFYFIQNGNIRRVKYDRSMLTPLDTTRIMRRVLSLPDVSNGRSWIGRSFSKVFTHPLTDVVIHTEEDSTRLYSEFTDPMVADLMHIPRVSPSEISISWM